MHNARYQYGFVSALLLLFKNFTVDLCTASQSTRESSPRRALAQLPATPFFTFPNNEQPENLQPRLNGQLLVTVNTAPKLYQINPFQNQSGTVIHNFDGYTSLWGIVELELDEFYVIASNYTGAPQYFGFQGSVSVFRVALSRNPDPTNAEEMIKVSKILDIPQAQLLDGFVVFQRSSGGVLIAGDVQTGTLYLIDVKNRTSDAVFQDQSLRGTSDDRAAGLAHLGINGLKIYKDDLYFTNTAKGTYGKIALDYATGKPKGIPQILANYSTLLDDLSFDTEGNQFISEPLYGILFRPVNTSMSVNRTTLLVALPGANSNARGRTAFDECILYSTFDGIPSGIARIDLRGTGLCYGAKGHERL